MAADHTTAAPRKLPAAEPSAAPEPADSSPFWKRKSLEQMTKAEWESLCDGCARCCLVKLEDEEDHEYFFTDVGCTLLNAGTCKCRDYKHRSQRVSDCVSLTPEKVRSLGWLPVTCAYRLIAEGKDLAWWHPLVSGDPETVHAAGVSVRGKVHCSEDDLPLTHYPDRIRVWPNRWPRGAKRKRG